MSSDVCLGFTGSSERGAVRERFAGRAELCASGVLEAPEPRGLLEGECTGVSERGAVGGEIRRAGLGGGGALGRASGGGGLRKSRALREPLEP